MTHHIIYMSLKIAFSRYRLKPYIYHKLYQIVAEINLYGYVNK